MKLSRISTLVIAGATILAVALGVPAATASEIESAPSVTAISETASTFAPDLGTTAEAEASGQIFTANLAAATAAIPVAPTGDITLSAREAPDLSVSLPAEVDVNEAQAAGNGSVVFTASDADATSVAVQPLADGRVSVQTVIPDASAPMQYTYRFADTTAYLREDGGVDLTAPTADGVGNVVIGSIDAPWAVDANGAAVPTQYVVDGPTVVQVITPNPDTAFPVVADPTFGHTYGIPTMYLSKKETREAAADLTAVYILCGAAGLVFGGPFVVLCEGNAYLVQRQAKASAGKCVKVLLSPLAVSPQTFTDNCK